MANLITVEVATKDTKPTFIGKKGTAEVFAEDLSFPLPDAVVDPVDFYKEEYMELATGTADEAVDLGQITTVKHLLIKSDQPISIKTNAGVTAGASGTIILMTDCTITAISISNNSGNIANVKICMAGE